MDTIRYFKDYSKRALWNLRINGEAHEQRSLQQIQHQVAVRAGFTSWATLLEADESERRLAAVMLEHPRLNYSGLGLASFNATREERMQYFRTMRETLRANVDRVELLRHWVEETFEPRKTIYDRANSYGLKHIAEEVLHAQMGGYVSNGEFIAAALSAEYTFEQGPNDEPNVRFAMRAAGVNAARAARDAAYLERSRPDPATWQTSPGQPGSPSATLWDPPLP
ncbi:hypothetical protein [Oerskovia merdavium]|uniref:Uncharacterized protein n=1 Tax=Oerskovia merdavium TaxID=2762227 RepID=A0ABR8U4H3_9CELL|nr:hypothetical protein [Oerskovia merdavium]MBD7982910.1 hypothetical protein [Oerskovia merdavium]